MKYARSCVELDVSKLIPDSVWIALPNDQGYWQPIVIEAKLSCCSRCKVHGHNLAILSHGEEQQLYPQGEGELCS